MKRRIFISAHYLHIGGAETALIGLLHSIDYSQFSVDLFLESHEGELMKYIPQEVYLLPEITEYSIIEKPIKLALKKGYWKIAIARIMAKIAYTSYKFSHKVKDNNAIYSYTSKCLEPILPNIKHKGIYDLAINFIGQGCIVKNKIEARKTVGWIHTDYSTVDVNYDISYPDWAGFDFIVSISPEVTKAFIKTYPTLSDKITEIENVLPKSMIESKALDVSEVSKCFQRCGNEIILVSIGRICKAKNYDNIPFIAKGLKKLGLNFHWFIIGPGEHNTIDALNKQLCVNDVVSFIGASTNPYPYIKACDIYVHPSRYEGKSIVVREAQMLNKPVIITNYPTAKSQITDGVDGIICELDNQKIAEAIYALANDTDKQKQIVEYLMTHDFAGLAEVEKIYKLIDR